MKGEERASIRAGGSNRTGKIRAARRDEWKCRPRAQAEGGGGGLGTAAEGEVAQAGGRVGEGVKRGQTGPGWLYAAWQLAQHEVGRRLVVG